MSDDKDLQELERLQSALATRQAPSAVQPFEFKVPDWVAAAPPPEPVDPEAQRAAEERWRAKEAARALDRYATLVPKAYRWALASRAETEGAFPDERVQLAGWYDYAADLARLGRVVLVGGAGSGKTCLAVRMLRALWDARARYVEGDGWRGPRAVFAHAHQLGTARIQHRAGDGEADIVERAMRAEVLVLDDLGAERDTATSAVPDVLFERHAEERPTWVTTGLTAAQIQARYGDGVARRVFERARVVKLGRQATPSKPAPSPAAYDPAMRRAGES